MELYYQNLEEKNNGLWVYIIDLPPSQMIEYGAVLPESGKEKQWFMSLSSKLKKKLSALEK